MNSIRVLVVDDSAVARRQLVTALSRHPRVRVAGTVSTGSSVLDRITQLRPDVVTLDVELPDVDGLEVLRLVKAAHPRLPVVMVSSYTVRGAGVTIDALLAGADDYVAKPQRKASASEALASLADDLLPRIVALHEARRMPSIRVPMPRAPVAREPVTALVIASSTGGPDALATLCSVLPAQANVPILVVQHMPRLFTGLLAERLARISALDVREAADGEHVAPGLVLVAPGGQHLRLDDDGGGAVVRLENGAPVLSCRPAADLMFADAARCFGSGVVAAVLTGMGRDGAAGAKQVHAAGGRVLVQDAETSVVWGMPGAVVLDGLADAVLPLPDLCRELARLATAGACDVQNLTRAQA